MTRASRRTLSSVSVVVRLASLGKAENIGAAPRPITSSGRESGRPLYIRRDEESRSGASQPFLRNRAPPPVQKRVSVIGPRGTDRDRDRGTSTGTRAGRADWHRGSR